MELTVLEALEITATEVKEYVDEKQISTTASLKDYVDNKQFASYDELKEYIDDELEKYIDNKESTSYEEIKEYVDEKQAEFSEEIMDYVNNKPVVLYGEDQSLSAISRATAKNNIGVFVGSEEPESALNGDIWLDSDDDNIYILSQVSSVSMAKSGDTITAVLNLDTGHVVTSIITLNDDGYPTTIKTDGVNCVVNWSGF